MGSLLAYLCSVWGPCSLANSPNELRSERFAGGIGGAEILQSCASDPVAHEYLVV